MAADETAAKRSTPYSFNKRSFVYNKGTCWLFCDDLSSVDMSNWNIKGKRVWESKDDVGHKISLFMKEVHFKHPLNLLLKLIRYDSWLLSYKTLIKMKGFSFFLSRYKYSTDVAKWQFHELYLKTLHSNYLCCWYTYCWYFVLSDTSIHEIKVMITPKVYLPDY